MSNSNMLTCVGLVTYTSEVTAPEGALVQADNVNVDEANVITPRRGFDDFLNSLGLDDNLRTKQLLQYKSRVIRHVGDKLQYESGNSFLDFSGSYLELAEGLRIKYKGSNGNLYFTTRQGIQKISARNANEFSQSPNYVVPAGAIKAYDLSAKAIPQIGGFLPPQSKVAYRCLFGYKDINNNLLLGSPSSRFVLSNISQDVNISEQTELIVTGNTIVNSDYFTFNTKVAEYFVWFDNSGTAKQPNNAETIGKIAIKVLTQGFTTAATIAGEIAAAIDKAASEVTVTLSGTVITITEKEANSSVDAQLGIGFASSMTITTVVDGQIIKADNAVAEISALIPDGVDTSYFFQLYRTAVFEKQLGLTLDDIDPGDECQLVYEAPVTDLDLKRGFIKMVDVRAESLRASGLDLYTNAQTGETILGANEIPPVAQDVEFFKGSMFYANTRSYHRSDLTFISVDDFVSGVSQFYVGDDEGVRAYTFKGQTEIFDLTVDQKSKTTGGSYILLNSASNANKFYMWFDKGSFGYAFNSTANVNNVTDNVNITAHGFATNDRVLIGGTPPTGLTAGQEYYVIRTDANNFQLSATYNGPAINLTGVVGTCTIQHVSQDPAITERIGIRIDLQTYPDTVAGTREAIEDSFALITDFVVADGANPNDVTISTSANGNVNDAVLGDISPGTTWAINIIQQGDGESVNGEFTDLSISNPTVVTAIDHGLQNGEQVELKAEDGVIDGFYTITYIDKDSFSVAFDNSLGVTSAGVFRETANDVLLSSLPSIGQAVDETARSLVRQINLNPESTVLADYQSGANDLPGKVFIRSKTYKLSPFYLAFSEKILGEEFNPELPAIQFCNSVEFSSGFNSPAKITSTLPHELIDGDKIYISSPETSPVIAGEYEVTVLNSTEFTIPVNIVTEDTSPSTCVFWRSQVVSDNLVTPNRLYYSKVQQPESVPITYYVDVGSKDGEIRRILALRDNLFILKDDGIYILSGTVAPNFAVRLLDGNSIITAPDSAVVLNNKIYALTDQGIVAITESGPDIISFPIENKIKEVTRPQYNFDKKAFGVAYENDRAYLLWLPTQESDEVSTQCYRYHIFQKAWTRWTVPATCGLVEMSRQKMYLGAGDRNYIYQERKQLTREDFADRSFIRSIQPLSYVGNSLTLSSASEVAVGDVIVQEQAVTVSRYNRLLRKLDLDSGLNDNNYESSLKISNGKNMVSALNALNAKLYADIGSPIDNTRSFSSVISIQKEQFNQLISELNDPAALTSFKNYKEIEEITLYEAIILTLNKATNTVTINIPVAFLDGEVRIYKGINSIIQWSPIHYGDPMAFKQVSSATCIFDQNNFYNATMAYSSDVSQSFVEVPFLGKGLGYWGYNQYNDLNVNWGGNGNDAPFRDIVPIEKQRCRYQNVKFKHINAREYWRILGITAKIRAYSERAYKGMRG
jgi:hypothetical protein